jgi:hypothetical protein
MRKRQSHPSGLGAAPAMFLLLFPWPAMASILLTMMIAAPDEIDPFWPAVPLLLLMLYLTWRGQVWFKQTWDHIVELRISRYILLLSSILAGPAFWFFLYNR